MPKTISRRQFIKISSGIAAGTALWGLSCQGSYDFDLIITGGLVLDGSGQPGSIGDVGIRAGRIIAIGNLKDRSAARKIDAAGLAVAPGFIDFHSHSDDELLMGGNPQSKVRQGVTLEVLGQDGGSMAPLNASMRDERMARYQKILQGDDGWDDFAGYFSLLDKRGMITNALSMLGQGTLRQCVVGEDDRPATAAEIAEMQQLAATAFAQGAYGISSGLEYTPGSFASTDEIIAICQAMNGHGIYSSHMRNEDDTVLEALEEAITIAQSSDVALNISHMKASARRNWHKMDAMIARLDAARASGMTVSCDRYPYVAYSTSLSALFPLWSRAGGSEQFVTRLQDAALSDSIKTAVMAKIDKLGGWHSVMISSLRKNEQRKSYEGKHFQELTIDGSDPYQLLLNLVKTENGGGGMVGFAMSEENTSRLLAYDYCMTASDASSLANEGPLHRGNPHPRGYGTFPRLLGKYVREDGLMPLEEAVRKITTLPAAMLNLKDRGWLKEGYVADVAIFDPATVIDNATWGDPHRYPSGMPYVIVNGEIVIDQEKYSGKLPGRLIRGS